jgi:hypothetical protein
LVLNWVLWTSFVRSDEAFATWLPHAWLALAVLWVAGFWWAARCQPSLRDRSDAPDQRDLFIQAQGEYLKGHWVEAQTLLEQSIRRDPQDIESHLLLASVFRRSGQFELSHTQLGRLSELDGVAKWQFELRREQILLERTSGRAHETQ